MSKNYLMYAMRHTASAANNHQKASGVKRVGSASLCLDIAAA